MQVPSVHTSSEGDGDIEGEGEDEGNSIPGSPFLYTIYTVWRLDSRPIMTDSNLTL